MKQLFYDLETTGVHPGKNGIHQISGIVVIDGEQKETFNIQLQPNEKAIIEDEALAVAGITRETLKTYQSFRSGYLAFVVLIQKYIEKFDKKDKFQLIGYNNRSFDDQFLRGLFLQNNDNYFGYYFWADSSDVLVLASECLKEKRTELVDFKLKTVAEYCGVTVDESKLHDAQYDIYLTIELYKHLKTVYFK